MAHTRFPPIIQSTTVSIASGAALSSAVDLSGTSLVAIQMPSAWTTANLTFQASDAGTTYNNVYNDAGTEYSVTAGGARYIITDPTEFIGIRYLKLRSGTAGTTVAQGAARTVTFVLRPLAG